MSDIALRIENISKQYRLGQVGTGTISHDLNRWWHKVRGLEDPYLKIGDTNDRSKKGNSEYVWALKDINFEVKKGEILGIIGKNGAGKSTLLKLLSKVTLPTSGTIKTNGRIASLLEVGTGFHPEMTGRENIYMNGTIMGMKRHEITSKLDEIVEFAGVERYLDTPTKRYSSGMTVRLGFAIAAHLEPEILVVDEVLAVGDAEFQKRAIGKMQEVSQGQGRTVLFVSHNMASIERLCTKACLLNNGTDIYHGGVKDTINYYLENKIQDMSGLSASQTFSSSKPTFISKVEIRNEENAITKSMRYGEIFELLIEVSSEVDIKSVFPVVGINSLDDVRICTNMGVDCDFLIDVAANKKSIIKVKFEKLVLTPGDYSFVIALRVGKKQQIDVLMDALSLTVTEEGMNSRLQHNGAWGIIHTNVAWQEMVNC